LWREPEEVASERAAVVAVLEAVREYAALPEAAAVVVVPEAAAVVVVVLAAAAGTEGEKGCQMH
jgi:hypothetical protein